MQSTSLSGYQAEHFLWQVDDGVATVTLNRPERKNPLTFESYAELRDLFRSLVYADDVHAVVVRGGEDVQVSQHQVGCEIKAMRSPTHFTDSYRNG